jgi:SNF2 family DNA or RNA helicase
VCASLTCILSQLRKICQHPYLSEPELDNSSLPEKEQHRRLIEASGKLKFLKQLLPRLKERGFRVLLFSQVSRQREAVC